MNKVMRDVDIVIHLAGISYSKNIIKSATKHDVKRVILVHTTGIYSNFKSASHRYKNIELEIDQHMNINGNKFGLTIFRPTMIYGDLCDLNISKFIKVIDKLRIFPVINSGQSLIQPVNVRDLGKAYYQVLITQVEVAKREYILSGEKPISIHEALYQISSSLNKKTIFINLPLGFGVFIAKALKIATFGRVDFIEKVQRMSENRNFNHTDAVNDFSYKPISFREGLNIEVGQYLAKKQFDKKK